MENEFSIFIFTECTTIALYRLETTMRRISKRSCTVVEWGVCNDFKVENWVSGSINGSIVKVPLMEKHTSLL